MVEHGPVAQGIEHRFPKPGVVGSNPTGVTMKRQVSGLGRWPFFMRVQDCGVHFAMFFHGMLP